MNPLVELNLALILFVPWFSILAVLFWVYPRQPRTRARKLFDTTSMAIATGLAAYGMYWGFDQATGVHGGMWKQVVATMCAYTMFLLVMTVAAGLRHHWLRRNRLGESRQPEPAPAQAAVREPTP